MRGFNIYTCFSCNAFDDKRLQYDAPLYTTPPGFQLIGVYPGVSPLTRLHHRAILWRPSGAQNSARCARGIWEEERLPPW